MLQQNQVETKKHSPESDIQSLSTKASQASIKASDSQGQYSEIVQKRLRTLKKRLAKIEKYEEQLQAGVDNKLNDDQLAAVSKKGEVLALIKELEDMAALIADKETEDKRAAKKKLKADNIAQNKLIQESVQQAVSLENEKIQTLCRLILAVGSVLPRIPITVVSKVNKQLLIDLYHELFRGLDPQVNSVDPQLLQQLIDGKVNLISNVFGDPLVQSQLNALFQIVQEMADVEKFPTDPVSNSPPHVSAQQQTRPVSGISGRAFGKLNFTTSTDLEEVDDSDFKDPAIVRSSN
ncbi:hypothetical protein MP228_008866 [Amoeboaphelidium protococcarum]|nr:hypothetical protein MP228_008866 [Amoeboaphelidium protococcarum]